MLIPWKSIFQWIGNVIDLVIANLSDAITNIKTKLEAKTDKKETQQGIIFPVDPLEFNPVGLVRVVRDGTKNGMLISWMDMETKTEVFRWDENTNYSNGSHYHVASDEKHYIPGIDEVPEPYASIYFPVN